MELVRQQRNGSQLLVGDLDARRIFVGVQLCAYFQPLIGLGVSNQIDYYLMAPEWLAAPVLADKGEEPMLDLVPFAGARRKVHTVRWRPVSSANLLKYTPKHFIVKLLFRHKLLTIQGKSRMRQSRSYGSVRGVRGNSHPYRDIAFGRLSRSRIYQGTTDHERRWSVPPVCSAGMFTRLP